jgi:menaquinone-dependent protoporphyrinogen IX oxidase
MKACVVYDSIFGNTAKIAEIIGTTLKEAVDYPTLKIACFDTRIDVKKVNNKILNIFVKFRGYALDSMEKILTKNGFILAHSGIGFFVDDSEGPLSAGETDKAVRWANELMEKVNLL